MFSKFNEETQKVLVMAKKEMMELKHPYVGSEHLILSILHDSNLSVTKLLNEYNITYDLYKNEIIKIIGIGNISNNWFLYTPLLKRVLENAILECKEDNIKNVSVERVFISLLEEGDGVGIRVLMGMNIDIDTLYEKFSDKFLYKKGEDHSKLFIDDFGVDFNEKSLKGEFDPVIGRDDKINRIIEILLRRTKNNPLLIGEAGVGKTAIIEELSRRITCEDVPKQLFNKKIYGVSMASLVAGTKYRGEFEERINHLIAELENQTDIILFIDEIHTLVGAGGAEGAIDASNIIKPYLARGKIRIIGATTKKEYAKYFEQDKALDRRFQKVFIEEPSYNDTLNILHSLKKTYEDYHSVKISDEVLNRIVYLSDKYISIGNQPDKAIDLLDEVCSKTSINDNDYEKNIKSIKLELNKIIERKNKCIINQNYKEATILKNKQLDLSSKLNILDVGFDDENYKEVKIDMLDDIVFQRTKIPIFKIKNYDREYIIKELCSRIIGQNEAINKIVNRVMSNKFIDRKTPYSFMLVGKTGIGKTMLVMEYGKLLYTKESVIKIDMSEYREEHSVSKIIGSPPGYVGYDDKNSILEKVKYNPYSIILLDEIEKACTGVYKLFLQVLDDGYMTTSTGEKVDFSNTIIFMTSNIGCNKRGIGFNTDNSKNINKDILDYFDIEFINRIDDVIILNNITEKVIEKIIKKKLTVYVDKFNDKNILSTKVVNKIKDECKYLEFGARRVDKVIEENIEEMISVSKK